jgi:hypothetical protein
VEGRGRGGGAVLGVLAHSRRTAGLTIRAQRERQGRRSERGSAALRAALPVAGLRRLDAARARRQARPTGGLCGGDGPGGRRARVPGWRQRVQPPRRLPLVPPEHVHLARSPLPSFSGPPACLRTWLRGQESIPRKACIAGDSLDPKPTLPPPRLRLGLHRPWPREQARVSKQRAASAGRGGGCGAGGRSRGLHHLLLLLMGALAPYVLLCEVRLHLQAVQYSTVQCSAAQ